MAANRKSKSEKRELVKQMKEISKELLSPSLLESLSLQKSMEIGAGRNKEDCAPSQYQLVAGGCCLLDLEDTAKSQYQLVAGAHNHLRRLYYTPNIIKRRKTKRNKRLAA